MWKYIKGYDELYSISNYGDVFNHRTNRLQKPVLKKTGYLQVGLTGYDGKYRTYSIHRLVALHFCNKPDGCNVVNHFDFNKTNNYYKNLEWTTVQGNTKHAFDNLEIMREIQLRASKAGADKTRKRIAIYKGGKLIDTVEGKQKCAEVIGVDQKTIWNWLNGRTKNTRGYTLKVVVPVV